MITRWLCLPIGLATVLLGGCISVDRHEYYRDREGIFDHQLLSKIQPKSTSYHWLVAHFGEPLYREAGPGDSEILTWQFTRQMRKTTRILGVIRLRDAEEEQRYLHAVLSDDKVVKVWRDPSAHINRARVYRAMEVKVDEADLPPVEVTPAPSSASPATEPLPPAKPEPKAPAKNSLTI